MMPKNKFFLISGLVLISVISVSSGSFCFIAKQNTSGDTASLEERFQKILLDKKALELSLGNVRKTNENMEQELNKFKRALGDVSFEVKKEKQKNKELKQKIMKKANEIEEIKARILIYQEQKTDLVKALDLMRKALEDKRSQSSAIIVLKNELEMKVRVLEEKIAVLSKRKNESTYLGTIFVK